MHEMTDETAPNETNGNFLYRFCIDRSSQKEGKTGTLCSAEKEVTPSLITLAKLELGYYMKRSYQLMDTCPG
jgi:hypothetical protein